MLPKRFSVSDDVDAIVEVDSRRGRFTIFIGGRMGRIGFGASEIKCKGPSDCLTKCCSLTMHV